MTIQNPVGGAPEDPYERYKKYRIEGGENGGGKNFGGDEPPKKPLPPGSFFLILLHKILDYFLSLGSNKREKEVLDDLMQLRDAFELMKGEDRSQDIAFLNRLSKIWHNALEHSLKFRRTNALSIAFRSFVQKIQNYPEGQEHTLGYYLTEYTGEKWLPFPYMELIQRIHEDHVKEPNESALSQWIQELDELISGIDTNPSI